MTTYTDLEGWKINQGTVPPRPGGHRLGAKHCATQQAEEADCATGADCPF